MTTGRINQVAILKVRLTRTVLPPCSTGTTVSYVSCVCTTRAGDGPSLGNANCQARTSLPKKMPGGRVRTPFCRPKRTEHSRNQLRFDTGFFRLHVPTTTDRRGYKIGVTRPSIATPIVSFVSGSLKW